MMMEGKGPRNQEQGREGRKLRRREKREKKNEEKWKKWMKKKKNLFEISSSGGIMSLFVARAFLIYQNIAGVF